ncbi:DNA gyrase inhibitor [Ewingella americana]|uniref:DNA gyrase inhibitor n=1 Tax=Ewingella americana TaxID=41202 RepID=A0A377NB74_9GAMM|nr:DNA gyrase inhibitor [Ewingella americana]
MTIQKPRRQKNCAQILQSAWRIILFLMMPKGFACKPCRGGTYAAYHTTIVDGNFAKAWQDFYYHHIAESGYRADGKACFEHYLSDGTANGIWEVVFYQHVEKIPTIR